MSDNKQVTAFDPKAYQEKVGEQVKGMMFNMLPDDQFAALVKKEWDAFFEEPTEKIEVAKYSSGYQQPDRYHVQAAVSPFRTMVGGALIPELQKRMQTLMQSEEWQMTVSETWNDGVCEINAELSDAMQKRFEAMSMKMVQGLFQNMMVQTAQAVKQDLMNSTNNPNFY